MPLLRPTPRAALAAVTALCLTAAAAAADAPAAAQRLTLDPAKSALEFQFVQAGAQNKGKFGKFQVVLSLGADSVPIGLDVVVQIASVDTGDGDRDDTLRGDDLFAAKKYPQAHFVATQITRTATGYDAAGKLTIRGVTRDQHVAFTLRTAQEQGHAVGYLSGKTGVKRLDYGIGQGDWKSTEWAGNEVPVIYTLRLQ
jgi:polyisoprenoid-binding protein YceI